MDIVYGLAFIFGLIAGPTPEHHDPQSASAPVVAECQQNCTQPAVLLVKPGSNK